MNESAVFAALCQAGLRMAVSDVPEAIATKQKRILHRLVQSGVTPGQLVSAIRYGMPFVWPFSEDGRTFDADDLSRNIVKALGEAAKRSRRMEIPMNAQRLAEGQ